MVNKVNVAPGSYELQRHNAELAALWCEHAIHQMNKKLEILKWAFVEQATHRQLFFDNTWFEPITILNPLIPLDDADGVEKYKFRPDDRWFPKPDYTTTNLFYKFHQPKLDELNDTWKEILECSLKNNPYL